MRGNVYPRAGRVTFCCSIINLKAIFVFKRMWPVRTLKVASYDVLPEPPKIIELLCAPELCAETCPFVTCLLTKGITLASCRII